MFHLLPRIDYGTENYPEKDARRLRAFNLVAWISATFAVGFALAQFIDPRPGAWKVATVNAVASPLIAALPLLHRFGKLAGPLIGVCFGYIYYFIMISLLGTRTGMVLYYPMLAAMALLFVGLEHLRVAAAFAAAAFAFLVAIQIIVPYDTGLLSPRVLFGNYVVATALTCTLLPLIVYYMLSEAARAEKVATDKTHQLEIANKYKSHFLASASHDLRQPLHALNLFVAQMSRESEPAERSRLVGRINAAVGSINELFEALLDMSKLEAGILQPQVADFAVERLLDRIETTFAEAARNKGLRLRVVQSDAWVTSDPILLERILLNLVSNAVRYTERGGVIVGCRHRGKGLRIDVRDSGPGIPEDQRQNIFVEFYQLAPSGRDRQSGLGLGLAIVDRLGQLLGHPVELSALPGRGSRFSVTVPLVVQPRAAVETPSPSPAVANPAHGKTVIVIDDDLLVLDGMRGILQSWGCDVLTASSGAAALASIAAGGGPPDLIIADFRLADGTTGIEAIERVRASLGIPVSAFIITGDTAPERLREVAAHGFHLLHKPVSPMALRATINRLLVAQDATLTSLEKSI